MMMMMPALSVAIERYLRATAMPETLFGRRAANDPRLVGDIRRGRRIGAALQRRIEGFMQGASA